MQWFDSVTISSVRAGYSRLSLSQPILSENGTGRSGFTLDAESYYKLSDRSTVWGTASYSTMRSVDAKWSNSIDYELLAPYVLGDSVGGNIQRQKYSFSGGWCRKYSLWTFGVDASYRAEVAYRAHDPRIHDIVSDLSIRTSVARRPSDRFLLGVGVGIRTYHQVSNVEFVNPMNDIQTYPLTGLGTFYRRFTGNNNKSAAHSLFSFSGTVQLLSTGSEGPKVAAHFIHSRVSMQLRSYNNITLGQTNTDIVNLQAAWGIGLTERWSIVPAVFVSHRMRSGIEMLFGSALGSAYEKIGERPNYSSRATVLRALLPLQYVMGEGTLAFSLAYTYLRSAQSLKDPALRSEASHSLPSLCVVASKVCGRWLIRGEAEGYFASRCNGLTVGAALERYVGAGTLGLRLSYTRLSLHALQSVNSYIYFIF
ncbi:MAG: hypothetical protein K2I64_01755 [Muribaculaceae bacterium]|nr:hypothetical protein [Muribaculaceae bacterium]